MSATALRHLAPCSAQGASLFATAGEPLAECAMLPPMPLREHLDRLSESVDRLAGEVKDARDHVTAEMRGLDQVIHELAARLQWMCNNVLGDQWRVVSIPTDPAAPDFADRVRRMKIGERISMTAGEFEHAMDPVALACRKCDCDPPLSFEQALGDGWTELMEDKTEKWNYLGLCPACRTQEAAEAKQIEAEVAARQNQVHEAVYCCTSPQLQWNGDPDAPGITCINCNHVVAEDGLLVFFEDLGDREPKPKRNPQKSLF